MKKGDKLSAGAWGHYPSTGTNYSVTAGNTYVSGSEVGSGTGTGYVIGPSGSPQPNRPTAYLRAVFFNSADTYLSTSQVNIPAGAGVWQQLALAPVTVAADGYVAVYVANESPMDVFFDDVEITVERLILQENHYYPFGLNMAGIEREGRPTHDYQYNQGTEGKGFQGQEGKAFRVERERDLGLGWDLTRYRGYDYQLGRFWQVDPKADVAGQEGLSPYQYSFNNPVRYNDPMGDCPPGKDCTDYLIGMGAAVVDNVLGGITPVRGYAAKYVKDAAAFNMGQDHGDGLSMVAGVAMMDGGGVLGEVGIPTAVVGTAIVAEGVIMTAAGASNLANQKGRLNAESNNNQGSGQGRGKNNRQPDPEATGHHSTINGRGSTTFERNPQNPNGWQEISHIDTEGAPHTNKISLEDVPVPHRQGRGLNGKKIPGGVEPVNPAPKYKGVDEPGFIPRN